MPHLLKVHLLKPPNTHIKTTGPKPMSRNKRILALVDHINKSLYFSDHAIQRMSERIEKKINLKNIKRGIAVGRNTTVLDKSTGNIRVTYKGRRIINKGQIITYMKPVNKTKDSVIKNHKEIHKYKPMLLEDVEKYRDKVILIDNPE